MKIAFTICSNNYLAQAKTLIDSLLFHNSDYHFIIGLCDKKNDAVDYSFFSSAEIIEISDIGIPNFDWMKKNYDIIELNTASKPFYFQHLFDKYRDCETLMYFDPDILVYNSFSSIEDILSDNTAVLTPHIFSPFPDDGKMPDEYIFLNYGLYNLGFIAVRNCAEAYKLLNWWATGLLYHSFDNVAKGMFVDQLPMNYAPIFFERIIVSRHPGYNFAYWNFHERKLTENEGSFWINGSYPLVFFHFSSFRVDQPLLISRYQSRFEIEEYPVLKEQFIKYSQRLTDNQYTYLRGIECFYNSYHRNHLLEIEKRKRKEMTSTQKIKNYLYNLLKR